MERETYNKRIAISIMIVAALTALIVSWATEEFYITAITSFCVGFALILDFAFAQEFGGIAVEKGYSYKKYVIWCYIFTVIGYLMVIALPDRGSKAEVATDELPDL